MDLVTKGSRLASAAALACSLTALSAACRADTPLEPLRSPTPSERASSEQFFQHGQEQLSHLLESMLRRADSLFSGNRSLDAPTGSYVQLIARTTQQRARDGTDQYDLVPRAKINLPKTSERLQVFLEQDLPNAGRTESQRDAQAAAGIQQRDTSQYAGLRGIAAEKLNVQASVDLGVRFHIPLDPFARARARRVFSLDDWQIPVSETLLYRRSDNGTATSEIGFLRPFGNRTALSLVSDAIWRQKSRLWDLSELASLSHQSDPRTLWVGELGVYGQTQPTTWVTAYSAAVRYRHKVYSDWVVVEVRPQLLYTRANLFHPIPSITLQLEAFFGDRYFEGLTW
jgi:hypothetical protein